MARVIGLRAKATAMPVPSWMRSVCSAARANGRKGSWSTSADHSPSYPTRSASSADSTTPLGSNPIPPSTSHGQRYPGRRRPQGGNGAGLLRCRLPWPTISGVTDDATDGRPWPIDPLGSEPDRGGAGSRPGQRGRSVQVLADFVASANRRIGRPRPSGAATTSPGRPEARDDEDRNRFGTLLDHADERGLLSVSEYEIRLGELAAATSIDEMREIVTELPAFTPMPSMPARSKRSAGGGRVGRLGDPAGPIRRQSPPPCQSMGGPRDPAGGDHGRPGVLRDLRRASGPHPRRGHALASGCLAPQRPSPLRNCSNSAVIRRRWEPPRPVPPDYLFGVEGCLQPPDHLQMVRVGPMSSST